LFVLPALFANKLYHGRCSKLVERARLVNSDRQVQLAWVAGKGGTSGVVAVVLGNEGSSEKERRGIQSIEAGGQLLLALGAQGRLAWSLSGCSIPFARPRRSRRT
jgi:hypothetical protein